MADNDLASLPASLFAGGTKAITLTPVVGTPRREYAETFVPGGEALEDGELRVTVLGSGNPDADPWYAARVVRAGGGGASGVVGRGAHPAGRRRGAGVVNRSGSQDGRGS
jgi:hypothetical protein